MITIVSIILIIYMINKKVERVTNGTIIICTIISICGFIILILDNLNVHKTLDVRLWALAYPRVRFLFQPTYSPWLNLIEPWWKTLRSLALKGRCFKVPAEVPVAIAAATDFWNTQPHPYHWRKSA